MMYFLYPVLLSILLVLTVISAFIYYRYKGIRYLFPLVQQIAQADMPSSLNPKIFLVVLRGMLLCLLAMISARMIRQNKQSIRMNGIDIMLVMDVSGSMELFDDVDDRRSRLTVAKQEAQKFTQARIHDSLGIIIFAAGAAVRCPVTFDKQLVHSLLGQLTTHSLNPDGTWLSAALAQAARKLDQSTAQSKIIIALTDGSPSPDDIKPDIALALLKSSGIKVYTIGIGSPKGGLIDHPMYGLVTIPTPLNAQLLQRFARETGGQFFEAKNADEMATIYSTIDQLEKTERDVPWWLQGYEYKQPLLLLSCCLVFIELLLRYRWLFV